MPPTEKMATESDHREVSSSWETAVPLLSDKVWLKNFRMICKRNQVVRVTIRREAFYTGERGDYCLHSPSCCHENRDPKGQHQVIQGEDEGTEGGAFTEK